MDFAFVVIQALNGLASASSLFILACGLTLVFGVTRIVNFAHGSLAMVGAYLGATVLPRLLELSNGPLTFWLGIVGCALAVGLIGMLMEILLLRRIYGSPELFQLLATFGVVLIIQDLVVWIFGPQDILGPRAPGLRGAVEILNHRFPAYELALIGIGFLILGLVTVLLKSTRYGILVRAATQDREMVAALGINQATLFTATLFVGSALAGLGGALQVPRVAANTGMDLSIIAECFVVTVIGGMGSVGGAFLAAILIGELQAFGILLFPRSTLVIVFFLMAVILTIRPYGLFGKKETLATRAVDGIASRAPIKALRRAFSIGLVTIVVACLAFLPVLEDAHLLKVATEILIFALFAFSLQFLIGVGGLVSFGHAAYFGLGAYGAALSVKGVAAPMEAALPLGLIAAGLVAYAFGAFVVRLSGIYLAMLTLAAAQLLYAIAFQWVDVTGGDNGLVGIWPSPWASSSGVYYLLTLVIVLGALFLFRRVIAAPFGYIFRAARDSEKRAAALGIAVAAHRGLAFALAGSAAGLAGALYAFSRGSVDPSILSIPVSIDALAMVFLGGVETLLGPLVGAAVLHGLRDEIMPATDFWRMGLGLTIVGLVLLFPRGLVGSLLSWRGKLA